MAAKKKKDQIIEDGVNKVFEDTPLVRATKNIATMDKQINLTLNRLDMVTKHMDYIEVCKVVDMLIASVKVIRDRALSMTEDKTGFNNPKEELVNERERNVTAEDQSGGTTR